MANYRILFNPKASGGKGKEEAEKLSSILTGDSLAFEDITAITSWSDFFASLGEGELPVLTGGDGTLNRFVNDTDGIDYPCDILYYPTGTGNDFAADVGIRSGEAPKVITDYLKDLPVVRVNGMTRRFLNGIGYGIDGYCCEVGDDLHAAGKTDVNYAGIAIKGLLFHFKPRNAKITIDGVTEEVKKVWLAPAMNGRMYGGGMIPTPDQKRLAPKEEKQLSVLVWHGSGKISTLAVFPSIFKGEHLGHPKMCYVKTGRKVRVEFDAPTALQIDGDTVRNVTSYEAEV